MTKNEKFIFIMFTWRANKNKTINISPYYIKNIIKLINNLFKLGYK